MFKVTGDIPEIRNLLGDDNVVTRCKKNVKRRRSISPPLSLSLSLSLSLFLVSGPARPEPLARGSGPPLITSARSH